MQKGKDKKTSLSEKLHQLLLNKKLQKLYKDKASVLKRHLNENMVDWIKIKVLK